MLDEIITPDVFAAAKTLRGINAFTRDDGTPLNYTLVNIKDWCKNHYENVNQLRISTANSHHRYDVIILINGVPVAQIELKTLGVSPRRAMEQIVEYKNDPGNGYTKTLLCFLQLFIVSHRDRTYYFANNNARHFAFHAEERFLPVYEFADEDNRKITHLDEFADRFLKKCDLGRTISRYMVLIVSEQKLMWEGRSALVGLEGLVSPAYTVGEPKPGVHSLLFSYYFKTPQLIEQFRRYSQGLVKDTLNLKYAAFSQISAPIPTFPEQQKIAECLSSVDELMAAQARKVDVLKTHKKGLMQQLFPSPEEVEA